MPDLALICVDDPFSGPIGPIPQTTCPMESDCIPGYTSARMVALTDEDIIRVRDAITALRAANLKLRVSVLVPTDRVTQFTQKLKGRAAS